MNVSAWLEAHCLCHVRQRYALDWATGLVCLAIAAASLETLLTEDIQGSSYMKVCNTVNTQGSTVLVTGTESGSCRLQVDSVCCPACSTSQANTIIRHAWRQHSGAQRDITGVATTEKRCLIISSALTGPGFRLYSPLVKCKAYLLLTLVKIRQMGSHLHTEAA